MRRAALAALLVALGVAAPARAAIVFGSDRCADQADRVARSSPIPNVFPDHPNRCRNAVWGMADDGSRPHRLAGTGEPYGSSAREGADDTGPSFAPDGLEVVFARATSDSDYGPPEGELLGGIFALGPSGVRRLTTNGDTLRPDVAPAVSPDGASVFFVGPAGIEAVGRLGGGRRTILGGKFFYGAPTFAPDGRMLFSRFRPAPPRRPDDPRPVEAPAPGPEEGTFSAGTDGQDLRRIADAALPIGDLDVSPDGRRIVFTTGIETAGGLPQEGLATAALDGSDVRLVFRAPFSTGPTSVTWTGATTVAFAARGDDQRCSVRVFAYDTARPDVLPRALTPCNDMFESIDRVDWHPTGAIADVADATGPVVASAQAIVEQAAVLDAPPLPVPPGVPPSAVAQGTPVDPGPFAYVAADPGGLRRVEASVKRRVNHRCRYLRSGTTFSAPRDCHRPPLWTSTRSAASWRARTARLRSGTYRLLLRATDVAGHRTRRPLNRLVTVRR